MQARACPHGERWFSWVVSPDGEEWFDPTSPDAAERERFLAFFRGLGFAQKVEVLDCIYADEVVEQLSGAPEYRQEILLDEAVLRWMEETKRRVEFRNGLMDRREGLRRLTGEESTWYKEGFREALADEMRDESLRPEGYGKYEFYLGRLHERAKNLPDGSRLLAESERGEPYLTVGRRPTEGGQPEWVRAAWEGVSIIIPRLKGGAEQEPELLDGEDVLGNPAKPRLGLAVRIDDAILGLLADGKRAAADWWMDHYEHYMETVLEFPLDDCEVTQRPGRR